jgi:pimeloyl-ACP methyl ester carboxylesterase
MFARYLTCGVIGILAVGGCGNPDRVGNPDGSAGGSGTTSSSGGSSSGFGDMGSGSGAGSGSSSASASGVGSASSTGSGGDDAGGGDGGSSGGGADPLCPVVVKDADCDKTLRPFVFVHGTYGSGDNFAHVAALLGSNGYCQDRIVGVEYDSIFVDNPGSTCTGTNTPTGCGKIDAVINAVLASTLGPDGKPAFTQVDLAGHSQGTSHCGTYLSVASQAAKVAHYINFSGQPNVGSVQTLSLSSMHDLQNTPHHACAGTSACTASGMPAGANVTQVTFKDQDHFAVAASKDSFVEVYKYLSGGKMPQYTEVQCGEDPVTISGIAETFADNVPVSGKIELRELGAAARMPGTQVTVPPPDAKGNFGPIQVKRNVPYEFAGYDTSGKLVGYSYFSLFKRSNRLVRLLTPPSSSDGSSVGGLVASLSTDHAIRNANSVTVVARWAGGAFRQDLGASLKVDGTEVLTSASAGTSALASANLGGGTVGLFMDDANQNMMTDLGLPYSTSFIAFTDVFMQATTPKFIDMTFTPGSEETTTVGEKVSISNWASSSALVSVMFQ